MRNDISGIGGYYIDTVGRDANAIEEYIRNQLQEDIVADQITLMEYRLLAVRISRQKDSRFSSYLRK